MLERINSPQDIKELSTDALNDLAKEIRDCIISNVAKCGGHLASNLGVVEATLVMHKIFNAPDDKIVFDVGHQCYAHKLITGRYKDFSTLRKYKGISGFTRRGESEYDVLTAGHSGSAISASLGVATANKLAGCDNYTVCVIGDGSFTNGMVYEALNNCNAKDLKLIIILNDNEMSISSNVGSLATYLSKVRSSKKYFTFKHSIRDFFDKIPLVGHGLVKGCRGIKNFFKRLLIPKDKFFDVLGVKYFGPVDGNNISSLETVLNEAKRCEECCLVHIKTKKGKGYEFAEQHPEIYHSVGAFDKQKGVQIAGGDNFSQHFGDYMCKAAKQNSKLCAITSAMCDGTGLSEFSKLYPDRFFDVGIAEEHEIAFAGGLSERGLVPVCAVYSTFAQRVYDQVVHDVAIQDLHIVLCLDRAGFVPGDGITHQGLFDVALFSTVPGCKIYSPETYAEFDSCMDSAINEQGVCVVRYPKGSPESYDRTAFCNKNDYCVFGDDNADVTVVTYGRITANVFSALEKLSQKGIKCKIIKLVKVYPLDMEKLVSEIGASKLLYFAEVGIKRGGVSEYILGNICSRVNCKTHINAVDNTFAPHASVDELMSMFGMDAKSIEQDIENLL